MAKDNSIRYDKFWAWISQDDRLQQDGEYTYWRDIDIRQGQFLQLEKKPEILRNVSDSLQILCKVKRGSFYYVGCSDGTVRKTTNFSDIETAWTIVYTVNPNQPVIGMIDMQLSSGAVTLFFFTETYMYYRTTFTDGLAWTAGNTHQVSTTGWPSRQIVKYSFSIFFFTDWKKISYVDCNVPWTVTAYGSFTSWGGAFEARNGLVGLTIHGNSFWAYDSQGIEYVIDQSIQGVVATKDFKEPILGVYNNSDYDIVITASGTYYKAIYRNGGVWPQSHSLIRRYLYSAYTYLAVGGSTPTDGVRFNFWVTPALDFSFTENSGLVYMISNEGWDDVIYSYGNKNNSLPNAMSIFSAKRNDWNSWGSIYSMWVETGYLFVAWVSGVTMYVEKIFIEDAGSGVTYQSSGYIITRVDALGIYEKPKTANKLLIGANIPVWTSVKIYYSMDEGNFTLLWTEIWPDEIQWGTWTATLIQRTIPSQSFNELAIKIELLTSDETVTPSLFSLEYNPLITKMNRE